jgi:hypothetical protein
MKAIKKPNDSGYVSSIDRQTAEKLLDEKLRGEGFTQGQADPRAPKFKLYQDKKTGKYIYRKLS